MLFYPKQELSKKAHIKSFEEYKEIYNDSKEDFHDFWEEKAKENLTFFTPFEKGLNEESAPFYKWFEG
jgi:acetyl-CoA synthetase